MYFDTKQIIKLISSLKYSNTKINIAFSHIARSNYCGAESSLFRLITNINLNKFNPILILQNENDLSYKIRSLGYSVYIIPFRKEMEKYDKELISFNPIKLFKLIKCIIFYNKSLIKILDDNNISIIWYSNIRIFLSSFFASKKLNIKTIWNVWSEPKGKIFLLFHLLGAIFADRIHFEYKAQTSIILGNLVRFNFFNKKIKVLYTGKNEYTLVEKNNFRAINNFSQKDVLILMASNIVEGKGQLDLIKVLIRNKYNWGNVKVLFAGDSLSEMPKSIEYNRKLHSIVKNKKLENNIIFLGWRNDIGKILSDIDIYVSTSYSEALPAAIREAMSFAKPVVATNVGGTSELVTHNEDGFLYRPGDIDALEKYLEYFISSSKIRKNFGNKGKKKIDYLFSNKIYGKEFSSDIEHILN